LASTIKMSLDKMARVVYSQDHPIKLIALMQSVLGFWPPTSLETHNRGDGETPLGNTVRRCKMFAPLVVNHRPNQGHLCVERRRAWTYLPVCARGMVSSMDHGHSGSQHRKVRPWTVSETIFQRRER
jgi:hypothetical protein